MQEEVHNVIIIGSGPAGLTAALYTARANLKPVLFAGSTWGGQLMLTTEVENFPGFPEGIQGPDLMMNIRKQAERFGTTFIDKNVTKVDFSSKAELSSGSPHTVYAGDEAYKAKAVIIATGADTKWLGLDSEKRLRGHGVSSCATCDGYFFTGKEIAVIGGGDSALEEATFLTKFATKVTLIHRRDALRASKIMQDRAKKNPKIKFIWDTEVLEVLGKDTVEGLRLKNIKTGAESVFNVGGVFVAIGHKPNSEIFGGLIDLDEKGYVKVHEHSATKIPGVFVSGDVFDHRYRQAVTAAGMGCMAAIDAERWLEANEYR